MNHHEDQDWHGLFPIEEYLPSKRELDSTALRAAHLILGFVMDSASSLKSELDLSIQIIIVTLLPVLPLALCVLYPLPPKVHRTVSRESSRQALLCYSPSCKIYASRPLRAVSTNGLSLGRIIQAMHVPWTSCPFS